MSSARFRNRIAGLRAAPKMRDAVTRLRARDGGWADSDALRDFRLKQPERGQPFDAFGVPFGQD
jgi:hypothetical protein